MTMDGPRSIVILGGGLSGASAAFRLRELGFDGRVAIVNAEPGLPYERPPLSKTYLRGESDLAAAAVRPALDYEAQRIELYAGRTAVGLDPSARRLELDDGAALGYDALLLATGSSPRMPGVPGEALAGVHTLRTVADADAIRSASERASAISIVGNGWIGSEVAASLRQCGHDVTLIGSRPRPLERVLGPEVGERYRRLHVAHGTRLVTGTVAAFEGRDRVEAVRLRDGTRMPADLVVLGVGARPRTELATSAGLSTADDGVAVDERLRTEAPAIFAAGDIAAAWHPRYRRRLRVEHWDNAIHQGRTAAENMLGAGTTYDRTPYLYSDQFDLGMEYRGFAPSWDRVVLRAGPDEQAFVAFWLADGSVVAAMHANVWDAADALEPLVASSAHVDPRRLADPGVPLDDIA